MQIILDRCFIQDPWVRDVVSFQYFYWLHLTSRVPGKIKSLVVALSSLVGQYFDLVLNVGSVIAQLTVKNRFGGILRLTLEDW